MTVDEAMKYAQGQLESAFEKWLSDECPSGDVEQVQRQWDESLAHEELVNELQPVMALTWEVRRLRSEIDSAREDLQSFVNDRNHWKTKAEAAEAVLQNLMSYLSVNGCRTEIDPENAELRIRDGINMLVRPVLERAELAEKALKEAQEQEPVAYMIHEYQGTGEKRLQFQPHIPSIRDDVTGPIVTALYARPVPAAPVVAVPAVPDQFCDVTKLIVPQEWRDVITELADDLSIELDMRYQSRSHYPSELRKYENEMQPVYRARALLQSTGDQK